jgi:hypothetical protein
MSFHLQKGFDITPNGVLRPGSLQDYRVLKQQPWFQALAESSSHVRFWVDWPTLQPDPDFAVGDPDGPNHVNLIGLDEQIKLVNADGLKVILMPYRYPRWANGMAGLVGPDDLSVLPQDRMTATTWFNWVERGITPPAGSVKAAEYRLPERHDPDSAWGHYVEMIFDRWVKNADVHGKADYIEVCNEPNLQLWPQRGPSANAADPRGRFEVAGSEMLVHKAVADMVMTVEHYRSSFQNDVICLCCSPADSAVNPGRRLQIAVDTPYGHTQDPFVPRVLAELKDRGFKGGPRWIWSYHNYGDQERSTDRVQYLRRALEDGGWPGLHRDGGPALAATEGGVRLATMRSIYRPLIGRDLTHAEELALQARHMDRAFHQHRRSTGNGAGVLMYTQYTVAADKNFDTGLRELDGAFRPVFDTFVGLEGFDPHDPSPSTWRPEDDTFVPMPGGDGRVEPPWV